MRRHAATRRVWIAALLLAGLVVTGVTGPARAENVPTNAPADLPRHALIGYLHASFANGSGYIRMADVPDAWDVIGSYTLRGGTSPALRGLMTWSINWDRFFNWEFMNNHEPFLNALP